MLAAVGAAGLENTRVQDVADKESALTTVVRAVIAIATRKSARVVEGVCVDCALEGRAGKSEPRGGGGSPGGSPPPPTQLTLAVEALDNELEAVKSCDTVIDE